MRRQIAATVLALLAAGPATAQLENAFEAMLADVGGGYYSGEDLYRRGQDSFVTGYITAVYDGDLTAKPIGSSYCVPQGVKNGQLADVAWQYLSQHPARRHLHAAHLVRESWRAAWPCPSKG